MCDTERNVGIERCLQQHSRVTRSLLVDVELLIDRLDFLFLVIGGLMGRLAYRLRLRIRCVVASGDLER